MKRSLLSALALFRLVFCFAQFSPLYDGFTGMHFRQDPLNTYLEVIRFEAGSPADISGLRTGDRIMDINGKSLKEIGNGSEFLSSINEPWIIMGIKRIGNEERMEIRVPRLGFSLNPEVHRTECQIFTSLDIRQKTSQAPQNYNIEQKKNEVKEQVGTFRDKEFYEIYDVFGGVGIDYRIYAASVKQGMMTFLSDESRDMTAYKSFDFEFLSNEDPLMEKNLAAILEAHLVKAGLKRSTENPDLLVILSFFSGQKDEFVPPQQIVSTKIKNVFNWYWGYIPVPVTQSKTSDGYTQMTYMANINVKILDASEIESSKTPPVIWSGSVSQLSFNKVFLTDQAAEFFTMAMTQFPRVWKNNSEKYILNHYAYTGIIYGLHPAIVSGVIPGSPADLAGIKPRDEIQNINGKSPGFYSPMRFGDWTSAMSYLYIFANFVPGNTTMFQSVKYDFGKFWKDGAIVLEYKIKRGGKKLEIPVVPEKKAIVAFESSGITLD